MKKAKSISFKSMEWKSLVAESESAKKQVISSFDKDPKVRINEKLYKKYRKFLERITNNMCSYCDSLISNHPGDVEHFRPKGRVADEHFEVVTVKHPKWGEMEHPGYFWLAYDWTNLLLSCIDCNRYRLHGEDQHSGAGKADRFPVEAYRASFPEDNIDNEMPLLIDPRFDEPSKHLEFREDGMIAPLTKKGEVTLNVIGLNRRETLVARRRQAFLNGGIWMREYIQTALYGGSDDTGKHMNKDRLDRACKGLEEHSIMIVMGAKKAKSEIQNDLRELSV